MSECSSTLRAFSQRDKLCVSENVFHGFSGQPHTLFASAKARDFKKFFTKNVLQLDIFLIQNNTVFKMPPNAFYDLALTMQSSRLNLHCRFYNPTICRKNLPSNSRFQFFESYDSDKSWFIGQRCWLLNFWCYSRSSGGECRPKTVCCKLEGWTFPQDW